MKKQILSYGLILSLLLTILTAPAWAAGAHGDHIGWTQLSGGVNRLSGSCYLTGDAAAASDITISSDVTLCLNGHALDMGNHTITVSSGKTLTICDCGTAGRITGTANRQQSLISVEGGTLNVSGGEISLTYTNSSGSVQVVRLLENSTGSFTGGKVSLTATALDGSTARATTIYQNGGTVMIDGSAQLSLQLAHWLTQLGSGTVWVTGGGTLQVQESCSIQASAGGSSASAIILGGDTSDTSENTATISGGSMAELNIYGAQSAATISGGSFDYINNQGTLTMTGGTVSSSTGIGILDRGTASLSGVTITAATGVSVTGALPTIGDGVTITATEYGVDGGAILTGAPKIQGGTADLCISSIHATAVDYARVDATSYTGDQLTVQEMRFPDAHQSGFTGYAVKGVSDGSKFTLTNGGENFEYEYDEASGALRLYNRYAHPVCGASCSHAPEHSGVSWQPWTATGSGTLDSGSYYLTKNVTLSDSIAVSGDVNLCLNGYTIKKSDSGSPFQVENGGTFSICDCKDNGQITGGVTATGGAVHIYGGTISGGEYAVNLGKNAALTLSGNPALSGTAADLKLYTQSGTTVDNAGVDATGYTGDPLEVEETDIPSGVGGYAIRGVADKFTLINGDGYHYACESGGYVIRPDHTHNYTYSGSGAVITETCGCGHNETATIRVPQSSYPYTGNAIEEAFVEYSDGWMGNKNLAISYSNHVNVGTNATAEISVGSATASVTFAITAKAFAGSDITISEIPDQNYTGQPLTPGVTIKDGDKTLTKGTDYDLSYGDNITAGSVTIHFKGNYSGSTTVYFNIVYAELPDDKTLGDFVTIPSANANGWYNQDITLTGKNDVTIGTADTAIGGVAISTEGSGTQVIYIKDGNSVYQAEFTYKLDKTAPTVSNVEKPGQDADWTASSVTVGFTASDNISKVQTITVTKQDGSTVKVTDGSGGKSSFIAGENGTYTVTITDYAGNETVETIEITNIDTTVPTLTVSGGSPSAQSLTLAVAASDAQSGLKTVTATGPKGEIVSMDNNQFTVSQSGIYTVTATDAAGNMAAKSVTVHSVTFQKDDSVYASHLVVDGGVLTAPGVPAKDGYTFDGWYNDVAEWNFTTDTVKSSLTLTAHWTLTAPTVTLTADKNNVTYGEKIILTAGTTCVAGDNVTISYAWYKDNRLLHGETKETLTLSDVADSGDYRVVVTATDGGGQRITAEDSLTVSITPAPVNLPNTSDTKFIYNGQEQTYPIAESELYTVTGNRQTKAGAYTVTVVLNDKDNYTWADGDAGDRTYPFTIAQKTIAATWSGLTQVYGDRATVQATLSGVVSGDDVAVSIAGVEQMAGTHPLNAALTGDKWSNYTLKNGTAVLTIQQKPVTFTVTGNVVTTDAVTAPTVAAPGLTAGADYIVTYRDSSGTESAELPTTPGVYDILVELKNGNYRHSTGSSGQKVVGSFTIAEGKPVEYEVIFDKNGTANGAVTNMKATGGSILTLPECGFDREDSRFTGWLYDGKTYQPGDLFTMPNGSVTFTAQWRSEFEISGIITEKTDDESTKPAEKAVVSLWLGATKIEETTTKSDGTYDFAKLIPGIYNLVVTKDVRTVTSKAEIKDADTACNATLPKGATSSIVKITTGSPDIVVGNLDTIFKETDTTVYTQADKNTAEAGGKVEITFTADKKQKGDTDSDNDMEQIVEKKDGAVTIGLVMGYKLEKTVTPTNGVPGAPTPILQSSVLLEVLLPLPAELQGKESYSIYRVHDNEVQELKHGEANKNALGEYFTVSSGKTGLTLYVKCFSTYAIGYTESSGSSGGGNQGGSSGSSASTYPPEVEQSEHGSVTIKPSSPQQGDKVTVTATPEEGYTVDRVIVTDTNGKSVEVTPNDDGTSTFVQPSGKVTITVTFRKMSDTSDCPRDESCPIAPFTDADRFAWYHDGVHYCVENGLMMGISKTTFAPDIPITRGMIVTILWRLEGSPLVSASLDYDDVKPEDWYGEAVRWADSAGVVTGYGNGKFAPNDPVTREQMAAMLWRYAGSPKVDGSLSSFADGAQTSSWAQTATIWAVEQGLIVGVGNDRLESRGQATRAQAATTLMRFAQFQRI